MPSSFGSRHAMQAWGTCDDKTLSYSMGPPGESHNETLRESSIKAGVNNAMTGKGWGFSTPSMAAPSTISAGMIAGRRQ
eukprot:CAMPEP_0173445218 /NCGR_PEP_ID=MMETSP1357-20121228/33798_1 /TAXON_ID=77926 /ORGANISM="Hemiselmis rufescens, Strain PCC563" /LENGTH=78 /DNA_ID=CAMNT_0014411359 /DNA_START=87 /DNA_END=323 /DNA_ORIENTATION=+